MENEALINEILALDEAIEELDKEIKRLEEEQKLESRAFDIYKRGLLDGILLCTNNMIGE